MVWLLTVLATLATLATLLVPRARGYVCMHYQQLQAGSRYVLTSPGWPANYQPGESCQWVAEAPADQRVAFDCDEFYMSVPGGNEVRTRCPREPIWSKVGVQLQILQKLSLLGYINILLKKKNCYENQKKSVARAW